MEKGLIVHTLIFNNENKILIIKRSKINDVLCGYWDIPGGTLEDGEEPINGAIREVQEETGLKTNNIGLFYSFSNIDREKNKQFITLVFITRYELGDIKLNPREHDDYKWIYPNEIKKYKAVDYLIDCIEILNTQRHPLLSEDNFTN